MALDGSQSVAAQDKRKEKARVAARARRSQEASIIMEMAEELHITQEKIRRIDKATIVKLAIDYIKAFEILCKFHSIFLTTTNSKFPNHQVKQLCHLQNPTNNHNQDLENANYQQHNQQPSISSQHIHGNHIDYRPNYRRPSSNQLHHIGALGGGRQDCNNPQLRNPMQQLQLHQQPLIDRPQCVEQEEQADGKRLVDILEPKLSTSSIFSPRTDEVDSYFLMINERDGRPAYVLKPDSEILDEDDLTHLAPQAGGESIALEVEPLEGIELDASLFGHSAGSSGSPPPKKAPPPLSPVSLTKELVALGQI